MRGGEGRGVELGTIILERQNNGILLQYTKCLARCVPRSRCSINNGDYCYKDYNPGVRLNHIHENTD